MAYVKLLSIKGFDIFNLRPNEIEGIFVNIQRALLPISDKKFYCIKTLEPYDLSENIKYTNDLIKKATNPLIKKGLEMRNRKFRELHEFSSLIPTFYLGLVDDNKIELKNATQSLKTRLNGTGLVINELTPSKTLEVLANLKVASLFEEGDSFRNLPNMLAYNEMNVYKNHIKIGEDRVFSLSTISEWNPKPDLAWMADITDSNETVIFTFLPKEQSEVATKVNKAKLNLKTNSRQLRERDYTKKADVSNELEIMDMAVDEVNNKNDRYIQINAIMINSATNTKELNAIEKRIDKFLSEEKHMKVNRLSFKQLEALKSAMVGSTDKIANLFPQVTTLRTVAEGFPFLSKPTIDKRGTYLGENKNGDLIILDPNKHILGIDDSRFNGNWSIYGKAGSGKTIRCCTLAMDAILQGKAVFIIDPESEYKKLVKYFGGVTVDASGSGNVKFNPLEIYTKFDEVAVDDEEDNVLANINNEKLINQQLIFLSKWFKGLNPEITSREKRYLETTLKKFYLKHFKDKDIQDAKSEDFPIMEDWVKFMKSPSTSKQTWFKKELNDELVDWIQAEFVEGKFSLLYNSKSKLDFKNLVNFDVRSLFEINEPQIIEAQFLLLLQFLQNELVTNGFYQTNETVILIDESHLLLNANTPQLVEFIARLFKRARKRWGNIISATQNPGDLVSDDKDLNRWMDTIKKNTQHLVILKLESEDMDAVIESKRSTGGITEEAQDWIAFGKPGEGLLEVGPGNMQLVRFHMSKIIKELTKKKKREIDEEMFSNDWN